MKNTTANLKNVIFAKVEPNEDLIKAILNIVKNSNIKSGFITSIGAFKEFTLGYFNLDSKEYDFKSFKENVELLSCVGNIAWKGDEPMIHLHAIVGRRDYSVMGGHLASPCIVSVTAEVHIFQTDSLVNRITDPKFNLSLLNL